MSDSTADHGNMSGTDWIGRSRYDFTIKMARYFEARHQEALEAGDTEAAERFKGWGLRHLWETQSILTGKPKRIVPDAEAVRLRARDDEREQARGDAERLTALKKKLGIIPRTNGSAYRPYRGGLPTLGKDR